MRFLKYEQYAQDGQKFVAEVASELGFDSDEQAERILTSVLHTLRDLLTPEESLHLVSQLPMMLKAIYVNGWRIHNKSRVRSMDEFIESLLLKSPRTAPQDFGNDEKAIQRAKGVFKVLRNHISMGEVKDIVSQLPPELTELWLSPEEYRELYNV
jgi:uncharacterized protein (DUF2267 family)